jgi:hypothetical protein
MLMLHGLASAAMGSIVLATLGVIEYILLGRLGVGRSLTVLSSVLDYINRTMECLPSNSVSAVGEGLLGLFEGRLGRVWGNALLCLCRRGLAEERQNG